MPSHYFGGAPNAFAGGQLFSGELRKRRVQENALAAMIERFGPEAGDPQTLAQLEGLEQQRAMQPLRLAEAQRSDAAQQALVGEYGAIAGDPAARATEVAELEARRDALHRGVIGLRMVRDRKGDLPGALQQFSAVLERIGMPPDELTNLQQQILTNPDSLDELDAMLDPAAAAGQRGLSGGVAMRNEKTGKLEWVIPTQSGFRTIPGYTPAAAEQRDTSLGLSAERNELGWNRLSIDEAKLRLPAPQPGVQYWETPEGRIVADVTPGSPQERKMEQEIAEAEEAARAKIRVFTGIQEANNTVVRHGGRALSRMDGGWMQRHGTFSAIARIAASKVPGSETYEMERDIQSVKDNIGINELLRIKESGSGLGQVPQQQLITLQSVLGRLEIGRDPQALRDDLENVMRIFGDVMRRAEGEVQEAQQRLQRESPGRFGPPRSVPGGADSDPEVEALLRKWGPGR